MIDRLERLSLNDKKGQVLNLAAHSSHLLSQASIDRDKPSVVESVTEVSNLGKKSLKLLHSAQHLLLLVSPPHPSFLQHGSRRISWNEERRRSFPCLEINCAVRPPLIKSDHLKMSLRSSWLYAPGLHCTFTLRFFFFILSCDDVAASKFCLHCLE